MKSTIELLEELNVEAIQVSHSDDEIGISHIEYSFEVETLEAFRKACEADYKIRCEQVGEVGYFNSELVGYLRSDIKILPDAYLFTLPNNGE